MQASARRSPSRALDRPSPRRRNARRLWAALVPLVCACDCGDEPQLGRLAPEIEVATDPLAFGEVPLGATKRVAVEVRNVGNAPLTVTAIDVMAPFGVDGVDGAASALAPGAAVVLDVRFRPTNDEPQSGVLLIASDDEDEGMIQIPLSGVGVQGFLTVIPTAVDFEATKVGTARSVELVLNNQGLEPVSGRVVTEGFDQPEHFTLPLLPTFGQPGPFAVPARADQILDLEYRPLDAGRHGGRIVFEICGDRCGLEVDVVASAADSSVQLEPPVLDFGSVGISQTRTLQLRVANGGGEPVEVRRVQITGSPDLSAQVNRTLPATVQAGDALGINVEYRPTSAAEVMGEVEVETGPAVETVRAVVIGRGEGPLFRVEPAALHFGVEREVGVYRRALLLVNAGSSDVRVTGVTIAGDPAYSLDALPGLPARLGPSESVVVTVLFEPTDIREYSGTITVESDDATLPRAEVPITGGLSDQYCELEVSPPRVSFGLLPPTYSRSLSARITNLGTEDCNVLEGAFRAPVDGALTELTQPWPATIGPGQRVELEFQYAPVLEVQSKGNYVMRTDDPVFPERTVSVFGTAEGNLDVFTQPTAVDFGAMALGCTPSSQDVLIINAGTVGVTIDQLTLTSSTSEMTLTRPIATPARLGAGSILSFQVGYEAQDLGTDLGDVQIQIQEFAFALTVPMRGRGDLTPKVVDDFEQVRNDKVDVLFVIDDSCSMSDDQQALAQNFRSFIQQADVRQVDFRIGITTTTVFPVAGRLIGPVMSRATPNLEALFQAQAAVGINGSGFEQGLEGMLGVLQAADRGQAPQRDLLRNDAGRVVIIVSDEDDQSSASVATYFQELRIRSPNGFVSATVTGQAAGCHNPATGSAAPSPRYEEFARLTGGLSQSICSNWSQTLANIGQAAFGLKSKFFLSRAADSTKPIIVRVNGVVRSTGWQYDSADNSIVFTQPPAEGSDIEVEYSPAC